MNDWMFILYLLGAALMLWFIVRMVRRHPGSFSKENLGKSFYTVGFLTLLIIGVVAVCLLLLM